VLFLEQPVRVLFQLRRRPDSDGHSNTQYHAESYTEAPPHSAPSPHAAELSHEW
jgi:hypothetical protein